MPIVNWTRKAETALDDIYEYIADEAPYYAERFVQHLIEAVDPLETFLRCGRPVPEADSEDIREIIYHSYRIIYLVVNEQQADVLSVIHSRRDLTNPNNQPWETH